MKERKMEAEKLEEEEFRRQMMAKFAEDDRIELMNAQKRRMKQLEHRRAVEKLIQDRREEYQKQRVSIGNNVLCYYNHDCDRNWSYWNMKKNKDYKLLEEVSLSKRDADF